MLLRIFRMVYVKLMTSENEKNHGSLILRIGAIFFGLGTLIYTGLEFLLFFEIPQTCISWKILFGINPVLYMVFVFMQMYYIFMHSRININKNKVRKVPKKASKGTKEIFFRERNFIRVIDFFRSWPSLA